MTTPTQAQIEAVAKVIEEVFGPSLRASETLVTKGMSAQTIKGVAEAALTAAAQVAGCTAQVGEPYAGMQRDKDGLVLKYTDKDLHETWAATIERCAQVAEGFSIGLSEYNGATIAAAIRKLKDEPKLDPNIIHPGKDPDFVFPEEEP